MPGVTGSSPVSSNTSGVKTRRVSKPFGFRCFEGASPVVRLEDTIDWRALGVVMATIPTSSRRDCLIHRLASLAPVCRPSRIVRTRSPRLQGGGDPVWIHADVVSQLLIPLRRAEKGQGSPDRQQMGGHALF